jgi:hypothetical protein
MDPIVTEADYNARVALYESEGHSKEEVLRRVALDVQASRFPISVVAHLEGWTLDEALNRAREVGVTGFEVI